MKFEHLIQVNDLANPMLEVVTREQLWRGLVLRAESPKLFMDHLDDCLLSDQTMDSVSRVLRFGELEVRDTVTFLPHIQVHYSVPAQSDIVGSQMRMVIEEPEPDALFVRFLYADDGADTDASADDMYNEFRKSAYQEADIDTIRVIRDMVALNQLGDH